MDQILKARKLGSATARRKRISQIEQEELRSEERYQEHRRRILYDEILEEDSDTETDNGTEPERLGHERDDSVETPSECSVVTPKDSPPQLLFDKTRVVELPTEKNSPRIVEPEPEAEVEQPKKIMPPSPRPKLHASLSTPADFNYNRFSAVMTSPEMEDSTPDNDEEVEEAVIVEAAKPVAISVQRVRPSVISIRSSSTTSMKRKSQATIQSSLSLVESRSTSPTLPPIPPRNARRLSQMSTMSTSSNKSGFAAGEATRFEMPEIPDLPPNAITMIKNANASRTSLSLDTLVDQPMHVTKKSSMPLLTSALKTSHSRMSSFKNSFMPPPSHPRAPSVSLQSERWTSRPGSRASRAPTSAVDVMDDSFRPFETVPIDLNDPPRPRTSHAPLVRPTMFHRSITSISQHSIGSQSVTALPTFPATSEGHEPQEYAPSFEPLPEMKRKKSFSTLRKRSESIGQAFKFAAIKSMASKHDIPLPPPTPRPQPPLKSATEPLPRPERRESLVPPAYPSKSPVASIRARKHTPSSYSPFPPSPAVGSERGMVGLGLRVR